MIFLFIWESTQRQELVNSWKQNFEKKFSAHNIFHIKNYLDYDMNFYTQNLLSWGLFAEKKLIIIDEFPISVWEKNEIELLQTQFLNLLEKVDENITLVFNNQKVDKRAKIYKKIVELWEIKDFEIKDEKDLKQKLKKLYNDNISAWALSRIIALKWLNFSSIKNELDKLFITKDYIDTPDLENISKEVEESIFLIIDDILNLNSKKAIFAIRDLAQNLWNNYLLYNSLIANLRIYFYIFYLKSIGNRDIANVLNMWNRSFILKKTYKISFEKFNIMYKNLIDIDVRMKSGSLIWSEEDDILYEIEKAILTSNF